MQARLLALAQLLLDQEYVDNEPDARLAALDILAATGDPAPDSELLDSISVCLESKEEA